MSKIEIICGDSFLEMRKISDEPELHLNRDWQQTLVRNLVKNAPNNQYILATHSVEVADAAESYQRILLEVTE